MDFAAKFAEGLEYGPFLDRYATDEHRRRWDELHGQVRLADPQRELLGGFVREMKVLCLAGTWCGDCVQQCPIFDHFSRANDKIQVRFFDRDEHADFRHEVRICGGNRVPVLVFLSEDGCEVSRFGDRTLSKYRQMALDQLGAACPTGIVAPEQSLLVAVIQDWLDEFERVHLVLRTSSRLREKHGD